MENASDMTACKKNRKNGKIATQKKKLKAL
jgi:hypothetical protein